MAPLAHNGASVGRTDPNAILNECRDIDRGIDDIEKGLEQLRMLQQRTLDDADASSSSAANRQLDSLSAETMALYRALTERVRTVKSNPESQSAKNSPQVGRVDRRLKQAIQQYQSVESQFRKRTQEQMARQYRIVRPDATEQEVRAAVEDTSGGQVFSQALMQSDRQGRARAALSAVQDRHRALQKIEQQMVELSQLFQDMDTLVVQQEAAVTQIEQKGEEVVDNLDKGNEEIGVAVTTARSTRKKKWICLGISGELFLDIERPNEQRLIRLTQLLLSLSLSSLSSSTSWSSGLPAVAVVVAAKATATTTSALFSRRFTPCHSSAQAPSTQESLVVMLLPDNWPTSYESVLTHHVLHKICTMDALGLVSRKAGDVLIPDTHTRRDISF
jgi:syntaxin 1B/2/3